MLDQQRRIDNKGWAVGKLRPEPGKERMLMPKTMQERMTESLDAAVAMFDAEVMASIEDGKPTRRLPVTSACPPPWWPRALLASTTNG